MKRTVFLLIALLLIIPALAQDPAGFLQISGEVRDGATGKPLHYASINLAGTNVSNVTNSEGFFTLKVDARTLPSALVTISHLGYAAVTYKIADFQGYGSDNPLKIRLIPISMTLDPALIRARDPEELVMAAIYRIKQNYPDERVGMTAFYREMVKKGNTKYLCMNEAILDIDKAPYGSYRNDRIGIYKGRGSQNYDATDTLFIKYQGGVISILQIDQAKSPFAMAYVSEIHSIYYFKNEPVEMMGDRMYYVVSFQQKPEVETIYMRGRLFIDSETLAIGRVEMWMNVEGREDAVPLFVLRRPQGTRFEVESAAYIVNYKLFDDKWYYDYARTEVKFATRRKRSLFKNHFTVTSEIAITDHKKEPSAIDDNAILRFKDLMTEKVTAFTDDNFWENYNVIEPDTDIEAIIRRIVRQLKRHNME